MDRLIPMAHRIFLPFSSRNYRLFFCGQVVSLIGSWMTQTATIWLVYHLTGSPLWLGIVAFAGQAPMLFFGPFAGVWVDRLELRKLLIVTQFLSMIQSLILAWLTLNGQITIHLLLILAVSQGFITAFDMPARQSLPAYLVEKREHLSGLIGLNASMFNTARLVGPAVAGFVIAAWGSGICFLIDGLSFGAVLAALTMMTFRRIPAQRSGHSVWHEFRSGWTYATGFGPIRTLILLTGSMSLFGLCFAVLIPVYVSEIFHGDARTLGFFMSASAAGSLVAALYLASRKRLRGIGHVITGGAVLMGTALAVFAFSRNLPLSIFCLFLAGLGGILVVASNNTLVQNLVDEDKRGRVMSLYGIAFLGGMPLGSLLTGTLATHFGVTMSTCVNALACLGLAFLFYRNLPTLRKEARPVLERAGLIPLEIPPG